MHLYTLVATPFVAQLLMVDVRDDAVREKSSWIQAAFLVGWALGGGFFGRIGDRLGRSRALMLTILTYALFTGLSFFAPNVVASDDLSIPGGARDRRRMGGGGVAAFGNLAGAVAALDGGGAAKRRESRRVAGDAAGILILTVAELPHRTVFLVGILPALLVLWIRRAVPEPAEWHAAKSPCGRERAELYELVSGHGAPNHDHRRYWFVRRRSRRIGPSCSGFCSIFEICRTWRVGPTRKRINWPVRRWRW